MTAARRPPDQLTLPFSAASPDFATPHLSAPFLASTPAQAFVGACGTSPGERVAATVPAAVSSSVAMPGVGAMATPVLPSVGAAIASPGAASSSAPVTTARAASMTSPVTAPIAVPIATPGLSPVATLAIASFDAPVTSPQAAAIASPVSAPIAATIIPPGGSPIATLATASVGSPVTSPRAATASPPAHPLASAPAPASRRRNEAFAAASTLELDGEQIEFQLRRSLRRRRAALSLCDRGLVLAVPARMPLRAIERFIDASRPWLRRHLPRWREGACVPVDALGRPSELLWLGDALAVDLLLAPGKPSVARRDDRIELRCGPDADAESVRALLRAWLRSQALPWFAERMRMHAPLLQVGEPPLRLTSARTLWGSCTPAGVIRLNWRLMQAPPALIDYVVVHELAHLRQPNHSAAFWSLVERACPEHRVRRHELRSWQRRLAAL